MNKPKLICVCVCVCVSGHIAVMISRKSQLLWCVWLILSSRSLHHTLERKRKRESNKDSFIFIQSHFPITLHTQTDHPVCSKPPSCHSYYTAWICASVSLSATQSHCDSPSYILYQP